MDHPKILTQPESAASPLSVRAKAVIFADEKSQRLLDKLEIIAPTDAAVLVIGETGTGKELVARHIHQQSGRSGPFVAVNCGALSPSLAEAELFGHTQGAFTGANEARAGWFESANGGTLFLDEIGDLPMSLQVKLLRVLQEREVVRLGSRKAVPLNVRLIAATNVDLAAAVAAGNFRLDLYYRLNVITFELPPLRARRGDILPLVEYFTGIYSARLQKKPLPFSDSARNALLNYSWPGNIRELENVVHYALLTAVGPIVSANDLRFSDMPRQAGPETTVVSGTPFDVIVQQLERLFLSPTPNLYERLEQLMITHAFEYCDRNQVHTAKMLGISRNILRTYLKRFGLIGNTNDAGNGQDLADATPDYGAAYLSRATSS